MRIIMGVVIGMVPIDYQQRAPKVFTFFLFFFFVNYLSFVKLEFFFVGMREKSNIFTRIFN